MKLDWRTEAPCWVLLVVMFAMAAMTWPNSPARSPVHWDLAFQPDRYGGRFEALMILPLAALGLYLILTFFPRIDPGHAHYESFAGAYLTVRFGILALLTGIYVLVLRASRTSGRDVAAALPVLGGVFLMLIGFVLRKLHPNWLIGIRTPWTLSSRLSWDRTHQVGSWVFTACGALIVLSPLVGRAWALPVALGVFGVSALGLLIYSYFPWRDDPDKVPPGGHARAGR